MTSSSAREPGALPHAPALQVIGVTKTFGAITALNDVSFDVRAGEVHALLGENGAGKSTLIKVLAGAHPPDSGSVELDGESIQFGSPADSIASGIGFIHQNQEFVPALSVMENMGLGLGYPKKHGVIDWATGFRQANEALKSLGLDINPRTRMRDLETHERQFVALCRALTLRPKLLLLDEVTASLTAPEVSRLFDVVRRVAESGVGVVYVSHRLDEILQIADRVTVLRDGKHITTTSTGSLDRARLAELIVGRPVEQVASERGGDLVTSEADKPVLRTCGVSDGDMVHGVDLDLYPGEIVGVAGLVGAGKHDLTRLLYGATKSISGTMELNGAKYAPKHPAEAIRRGVVMVTEDRGRDGYIPRFTLWKNVTLPWTRRFERAGVLSLRRERNTATADLTRLRVKAPSANSSMSELSGGNQQKVILARWTAAQPQVLLLGDPTHGVDVGSRAEIYAILRKVARDGAAVLVASEDLEELAAISHRVILMRHGRLVGELRGEDIEESAILSGLLMHGH